MELFDQPFLFWITLVAVFIAYHVGTIMGGLEYRKKILEEYVQPREVKVDVQVHQGSWYAFNDDTREFIAQAPSFKELQLALSNLDDNALYVANEPELRRLLKEHEVKDA